MATASNEMTQHAESAGDGPYKPSEHGGQKKDGSPDKRVSSEHGASSRALFGLRSGLRAWRGNDEGER